MPSPNLLMRPHVVTLTHNGGTPPLWTARCACGWTVACPYKGVARHAYGAHLRELLNFRYRGLFLGKHRSGV